MSRIRRVIRFFIVRSPAFLRFVESLNPDFLDPFRRAQVCTVGGFIMLRTIIAIVIVMVAILVLVIRLLLLFFCCFVLLTSLCLRSLIWLLFLLLYSSYSIRPNIVVIAIFITLTLLAGLAYANGSFPTASNKVSESELRRTTVALDLIKNLAD